MRASAFPRRLCMSGRRLSVTIKYRSKCRRRSEKLCHPHATKRTNSSPGTPFTGESYILKAWVLGSRHWLCKKEHTTLSWAYRGAATTEILQLEASHCCMRVLVDNLYRFNQAHNQSAHMNASSHSFASGPHVVRSQAIRSLIFRRAAYNAHIL